MSRRIAGIVLIFTSAMLYAARYLAAAVYGSSLQNNWSDALFYAMLKHVGQGLVTWSIIALVSGLIYLAWAEVEATKASRSSLDCIDKD